MTDTDGTRNDDTVDGLARILRDGRITRRGFLARAAGLVGGLAAAEGLLARVAGAQTTGKSELVIALTGDISKLDPHLSAGAPDLTVTFNLFDHLVSRHGDNKLHPALATEWKAVNPTTWHFKLRPGVRCHNGDALGAADVKFSIERTYDPKARTNVATVFTTVDRIETPDPLTVLFHTKKPDPLLPARLAFYGGHIMPSKHFESVGPDQFNAKPVGSGPVKYVSWTKDDRVVLDAFADYWGGKPDFERVVFRPIPETAPRIAALLKGEVDISFRIPPDHVDRIAKHPTTKIETALFAGHFVLAVNSKRPPLDQPKVKQALSLAIDREAILKALWLGYGVVPTGMVAKGDNHYDESLPPLRHDPNLAKQRLKEAGYKGEEIILETTLGYMANDKAMSETVVSMWRDVGINAKIETIEVAVRAQRIRERSMKGLLWAEPTSTLGDPDGMAWRLLSPGAFFDYWRHPRFDELGNAARFSFDEKFRAQAYQEMNALFLEHFPWIPVIQGMESYGLQKYLDWQPYSNQQVELRNYNFKFRRA